MTEPQVTTALAEMVTETVAVIGFEGAKLATRQDSTGDALYQKRIPTRGVPPSIQTTEIKFPSGRTADELYPVDLAHVAWAAQLGTIVFHPWPVRRSDVDVAHDLTPLLEWSEGDERDGQGDMPHPPEDQKVRGEPKRVQPSKDRDRNRDNAR